jgi:hypothetical protein
MLLNPDAAAARTTRPTIGHQHFSGRQWRLMPHDLPP